MYEKRKQITELSGRKFWGSGGKRKESAKQERKCGNESVANNGNYYENLGIVMRDGVEYEKDIV